LGCDPLLAAVSLPALPCESPPVKDAEQLEPSATKPSPKTKTEHSRRTSRFTAFIRPIVIEKNSRRYPTKPTNGPGFTSYKGIACAPLGADIESLDSVSNSL
jgi:hypothetical protein